MSLLSRLGSCDMTTMSGSGEPSLGGLVLRHPLTCQGGLSTGPRIPGKASSAVRGTPEARHARSRETRELRGKNRRLLREARELLNRF